MDTKAHWEKVYETKSPNETSWYAPHLQTSLDWILLAAPDRTSAILDVGGGESSLVDDLLAAGYRSITVLDLAQPALNRTMQRLGPAAEAVHCLAGDVTTITLPAKAFDVWHDRAVFHFLTEPAQRQAYVRQVAAALKPGGAVIMATFALDGPEKCSGLETRRYDAESLTQELGPQFTLRRTVGDTHQTPFGTTQSFLYCQFQFTPTS
jgi:2-polyprenyl-3-methyl-5-hydroxy-6-metoxy-1,4-benzoquinol methylase